MIARLLYRALTRLIGEPTPYLTDEEAAEDAMVVVVPALEPDEPAHQMPRATAEWLAEQSKGRYALPLDAAKDALMGAKEFAGELIAPVGRHRAVWP